MTANDLDSQPVVVAATRTAIGRAGKGCLAGERAEDLLASVFRSVISTCGIEPSMIDDIVVGQTAPCGPYDFLNVARGAALLAGIPYSVPTALVNRACASSLQGIRIAAHAIWSGEADIYLCGGVESMSQWNPAILGSKHPDLTSPPLTSDLYVSMGLMAENVADRYGVTRENMDQVAQSSHERAVAAQKSGFMAREITAYVTAGGQVVERDDGPRPDSSNATLAGLMPIFTPHGQVTAGNSSPLNDGAAAVVVTSSTRASELGVPPLARILASTVVGIETDVLGVGPVSAVRRLLSRVGMTIDDIDIVEINEAFASMIVASACELGIDPLSDTLNPFGGALALGHPFGMSGARIMATLLNGLSTLDKTIGIEAFCVGGGQGMAMLVERLS